MNYTPEQTKEIIARISQLRSYWRRPIEIQMTNKSQSNKTESEKSSHEESR